MRIEKDALGEMPLPDGAYYGIQAFRSLSNFDVTDKTFNDYPAVVRAPATTSLKAGWKGSFPSTSGAAAALPST